jgi:hypothetical protein
MCAAEENGDGSSESPYVDKYDVPIAEVNDVGVKGPPGMDGVVELDECFDRKSSRESLG